VVERMRNSCQNLALINLHNVLARFAWLKLYYDYQWSWEWNEGIYNYNSTLSKMYRLKCVCVCEHPMCDGVMEMQFT